MNYDDTRYLHEHGLEIEQQEAGQYHRCEICRRTEAQAVIDWNPYFKQWLCKICLKRKQYP